jgi:flagellar biosynthesis/type III secretory pathway ATPase
MSLSDQISHINLDKLSLQKKASGTLIRMVGLTLEAEGLVVKVGDRCMVERRDDTDIEAEVVGFDGSRIFLMPIEQVDGLQVFSYWAVLLMVLGDLWMAKGLCMPKRDRCKVNRLIHCIEILFVPL